VLGAPGSGKTTLLIERLVALHRAGVSPDGLLILTPTRVMASRVRDQVGSALGVTTAGPGARSMQAFAFAIVAEHHRERGLAEPELIKARLLDADIQQLLEGHLEDGSGPVWPEPLGDEARSSPRFRTELREWHASRMGGGGRVSGGASHGAGQCETRRLYECGDYPPG